MCLFVSFLRSEWTYTTPLRSSGGQGQRGRSPSQPRGWCQPTNKGEALPQTPTHTLSVNTHSLTFWMHNILFSRMVDFTVNNHLCVCPHLNCIYLFMAKETHTHTDITSGATLKDRYVSEGVNIHPITYTHMNRLLTFTETKPSLAEGYAVRVCDFVLTGQFLTVNRWFTHLSALHTGNKIQCIYQMWRESMKRKGGGFPTEWVQKSCEMQQSGLAEMSDVTTESSARHV